MARKTQTVVIPDGNRDAGKTFVLTEMPAMQAERWATRALMAIGRGGLEMPEDFADAGMAGLAAVGIRALTSLAYEDAEPLLNEMLGCVHIVPDPARPAVTRAVMDDDIEEVSTLLTLRSEVAALHLGFSITAALSNLGAAAKAKLP